MDEPSSSSRNNDRSNQLDDSTRGATSRGRPKSDRFDAPPPKQVLPPPPPEEDASSPRKRSRTAPHPNAQHAKMPRKETDVVDRIWHDIDEEQREKQAKKKAAAEEAKKTEPQVTTAGQCVDLTVNNLKNFKNEDSTVNDFIGREGMVDRLLGYKMLLGKMENCATLGYEKMNDEEVKQLSKEWFKKFHPDAEIIEPEAPPPKGPRTPPSPPPERDPEPVEVKPRRGPRTPPGSPGPSNPPNPGAANRKEMVEQLARTFGQSTHEVEEALGGELDRALEDCSKKLKNEMMETFKQALKKMIDKKTKISSDLSDQMELVSDTSLSVDMKIVKKDDADAAVAQYHMAVPPPPLPPNMQQPGYPYYPPGPPAYQYPPPPPAQPHYQQGMLCYVGAPNQHYAPPGHPPPIHYQIQPNQQYQPQQMPTMVLPPVNVPPPPMGVRIDTPMPQQIPPVVQALPPTGMPPPPIPPQGPPPMPPPMQALPSAPPPFAGDCWRPNPPPPQPIIQSDSWQQSNPVVPVAVPPPVSTAPIVAGVQTTLFSALGLHKPPPPPPPPPIPGSSAPVPPFASLSGPPPPPPPIGGSVVPSAPCPLNFPPPPPPPSQSAVVLSSPTSNGYRHHGSAGRVPPFSHPFNNF